MTRLSWGRYGPKATSIDGKGVTRKPAALKAEEPLRNRDKRMSQHDIPPTQIQIPKSRTSVELHLASKKHSGTIYQTDKWIDSLPPPRYANIPAPAVAELGDSNKHAADHVAQIQIPFPDIAPPQSTLPGRPSPSGYNPELESFLNSAATQSPRTGRRRKESTSSSSTLFEPSQTVPITIVVTTPEDELPLWSYAPSYGGIVPPAAPLRRNDSTMSLPVASSFSFPDRNRLMPPIVSPFDARKLRKAQELAEIRHFLLGFLNAKGDQFPKKLRTKLMSIYGIAEGDLDPKTVARFGLRDGEANDEGIVLEHGLFSGEPEDRDHLRILEMAFRSVIPVVTPTPHPAHEILRTQRISMSSPALASLNGAGEKSPIAKRMSLSENARSKTTLDSIINMQSAAKIRRQSLPFPLKRSSTVTSLPSKPLPKSVPIVILPQHKVMPSPKPESTQRPLARRSTMSAPSTPRPYLRGQPSSAAHHNAGPPLSISRHLPSIYTQEAKSVTGSTIGRSNYTHYGGAYFTPALKTDLVSRPLVQDPPDEPQQILRTRSLLRKSPRPSTAASNPESQSRPLTSVPPFPTARPETLPQVTKTSDSRFESQDSNGSSEETHSPKWIAAVTENPPQITTQTPLRRSFSLSTSHGRTRTHAPAPNVELVSDTEDAIFPQHPAVSPLRGKGANNWLKVDAKQSQIIHAEQKEKSKRSSIFGLLRGAFGGSKKVKETSRSGHNRMKT